MKTAYTRTYINYSTKYITAVTLFKLTHRPAHLQDLNLSGLGLPSFYCGSSPGLEVKFRNTKLISSDNLNGNRSWNHLPKELHQSFPPNHWLYFLALIFPCLLQIVVSSHFEYLCSSQNTVWWKLFFPWNCYCTTMDSKVNFTRWPIEALN